MKNVVLSTLHQKARWIKPHLVSLGYELEESTLFDTDSLGTFSNEVERTLSPKESALAKAKKAGELRASDWGLGQRREFWRWPSAGINQLE